LGDFYVLWSRTGTTVFLRSSKNAAVQAGQYVRMDGAGTLKWLNTMDELQLWLWVRPAEDDSNFRRHVWFIDSDGAIRGDAQWETTGPDGYAAHDPRVDPQMIQAYFDPGP